MFAEKEAKEDRKWLHEKTAPSLRRLSLILNATDWQAVCPGVETHAGIAAAEVQVVGTDAIDHTAPVVTAAATAVEQTTAAIATATNSKF